MNPIVPVALLIAWTWDALFAEPSDAWHPVAWLGRLLGPVGRRLCGWPAPVAFAGGALMWVLLAGVLGAAAQWLQVALRQCPWALGGLLLACVLKPCFAWRMLRDEVVAVEDALGDSLAAGRSRVGRLVSRDVRQLDAGEVRETAIETLAENLNDSVVAPLFWFALAGLPGAVVYRFANTADAMWGYRGRFEWAGKFAARADDVLSWLPARLTAALLWPRPLRWGQLALEAASTPSPNGGWPMGAVALRLDVRLRKPGAYALNASARSPKALDTAHALRLCTQAAWLAMVASVSAAAARWA